MSLHPGATAPVAAAESDSAVDRIRHLIHEACEPVAQFWPMKRFVHHNPIHGLEHLPFDRAVREAHSLLGGQGYLANREYRQLYRDGRIKADSLARALDEMTPSSGGAPAIRIGDRQIEAREVCRRHLLFGFDRLEPALVPWALGASGATTRFQDDLPHESRQRLLSGAVAHSGAGGEVAYVAALWDSVRQALARGPAMADTGPDGTDDRPVDLPARRTVADWVEVLAGMPVVEPINAQMIKWLAAFVDEGMAGWAMPRRDGGFYRAWRELAPRDRSLGFLGIKRHADRIRRLPEVPETAIVEALERLGVPETRWTEYLSRHLAQLPGWAGLVRWLGENPGYHGQEGHPADVTQYVAVRLFYEVELVEAICRRRWRISGTVPELTAYWQEHAEEYRRLTGGDDTHLDPAERVICERAWPLFRLSQFLELKPAEVGALEPEAIDTLLRWVAALPDDRHGPIWLEAYEDTYRRALVAQLTASQAGRSGAEGARERPRAQVILCIDVRSESFRRHIEASGLYETYGYAGFFGVAMNHSAFDGDERFPLCPVLLSPRHAVDETVRRGEEAPLQSYASGTRWLRVAGHLFHDLKQHPASSLMLVDATGFFFSAGLVGKTLVPAAYRSAADTVRGWFRHRVRTRVAVDAAAAGVSAAPGFTVDEQAGMVEGGLRTIGLTERFGRFVVACGHGSVTDNNPYFGALHCGACGGKHGDANARAFAAMANHPEVRARLRSRGIDVPDDTWFLPAKHITTSDRIEWYDVDEVPAALRSDLRALQHDLERAGAAQALERCRRIPGAGRVGSPERAYDHVHERTADWANVRPEWGLSSNAAFIIGRRTMTRAVNLQGRTFLHSYDPDRDPEGAILERIMTAPLIVGQWINMEHYFSAVDPWFWGSGSKVIHNVVSGVGVMLGSQSDLQTGLPLQTVNNGAAHHHEPLRLLTVIEAPTARIAGVIAKHALLQQLFHNGWLNLVAIDPGTRDAWQYRADGTWQSMPGPGEAEGRPDGSQVL